MVGFKTDGPLKIRAIRYVVGMAFLALIYLGLKKAFANLEPAPVFKAFRYGSVGLFAVFGGPYLFKRLGL